MRNGKGQLSPALLMVQGVMLLATAGLLAKFTIDTGIGHVMARKAPSVALRYAPHNPDALANQASLTLQQGTPGSIVRASNLALKATRYSPAQAKAYSVLGYVADATNHPEKADKLVAFSGSLSRRNLLTHLWFIEKYSAQGDIDQTLRHYDLVLKTSQEGFAILLPVLIEAAKSPTIQAPLTKFLVKDPSWADPFLRDFIAKSDAPDALVMLAQRLRHAGHPLATERKLQLLTRLVELERFDDAATVMGLKNRAAVFDGDFQQGNALGPFSWNLTNNYTYGAAREPQPAGKHALTFFAERSAGGTVARQLLVLPPGQYRLATQASYGPEVAPPRPSWQLICAIANQKPLATLDLPSTPKSTEASTTFSVPNGCNGQWITLRLQSPDDIESIIGQVDSIKITRIM
ncbi:hypothetical protein [Sphingomonas sp. C3-2]|uniref:tetratricopeptide repeat protein n=1 Tax=Sphingomonas sp. C3-2 TaxID=3062169 RepID=UPI00294B2E8C|nr:hypothetical protein [Sphingomonas sp. C3-2]WOK35093.1 hypothetical protein QYC26_08575 [Sphingomonas sp. C3-2]